jgi:lipoprotein-releasing system permease protein
VQQFEWIIGLRYSRAKRRNGFISFISLVSVLGITLGVAALIIVLSVMNGFQEEVRNRILGATSHLEISGYDNVLANWQGVAQQINQQPHIVATAPYVLGQALVNAGGVSTGLMIRGVLPEQEDRVAEFGAHMVRGQLTTLVADEFRVVLGASLAAQLGVTLGDKVTIITPQGQVTPAGMLPRIKQFTVSGIFRMDAYQYDAGLALIHLQDAQKLYRLEQNVSGLRVKLTDLFQAPTIARTLTQHMPDYLFTDWTQQNANYFRAVQIEKRMMFIILTLIIAVAAFNLVSTLVMVVTDKEADIAILRTLGAPARSIMKIFVIQGAFSGLIGTGLGVGLGVLVAMHIDVIIPALESVLGFHFLSPEVYQITDLPSQVLLSDVSTIGTISLLLSFIATLYPSWRAARVQPAEALRYE